MLEEVWVELDIYIDKLEEILKGDTWNIIKYRLLILYVDRLQKAIEFHIVNQNWSKVSEFAGKIAGVKEAIEITEHLSREIREGKLDVNVALNVMENKLKQKE